MSSAPRLLIICMLFIATRSQGQTTQPLHLDQATVFLKGAELTSSATLSLSKGANEIIFSNVAADINNQSITVSATNGVTITATTFNNNYLDGSSISPRVRELKDSIEIVTDARQELHNKIVVLDEESALLWKYKRTDSTKPDLPVAELVKLLDLINAKMEGLLDQKSRLQKQQSKMDEHIARLNKQLAAEQQKAEQPGGQLIVKCYTPEATTTTVAVTYFTRNAGWSPTYDIMADNITSPIKLFYKANIHQNSGINWKDVHLVLSTGNPVEGADAPTLRPAHIGFVGPQQQIADLVMLSPKMYVSDTAGRHMTNDESSLNQYVAVDNAGINTTFDIDLPYTIPADGQQHLVAVKQYDVPATYHYYAAPKLDNDAFLQAQITNWADLNLLPGPTNIFYEGTFAGHGRIDAHNVTDTMTISLGRDKKIIVNRVQDTRLRSVKMIGTNIHEIYAYSISVRNTRKENINLTIEDQLPVSDDKDIEITDKETGNAMYDDLTGLLKWERSLGANETKQLAFGYTLKYPKGKTVTNAR